MKEYMLAAGLVGWLVMAIGFGYYAGKAEVYGSMFNHQAMLAEAVNG